MIVDTVRINIVKKDTDGKNMRMAFSKPIKDILKETGEVIGYEDMANWRVDEELTKFVVAAYKLGLKEYENSLKVMEQLEQTMDKFDADERNVEME